MDQLINLVAEKTGISNDMARTAVETVLGFVKDKLPEPLRGQLDGLVGGGGQQEGGTDIAGQAMNALGNMFGGGN
ncbi:MAG: hypothetical protein JNL32_02485 [Candidatus Kapabacteria bacterium]|nr:hypothetical protein [Candidatus Kapabacteria bacterium]